jgi:hypothetical protein
MKCRYQPVECRYVDTAIMHQDVSCRECELYDRHVRPTGALPAIKLPQWFKSRVGRLIVACSLTLISLFGMAISCFVTESLLGIGVCTLCAGICTWWIINLIFDYHG